MNHYYGDLVRKLFIVAAVFMVVTLPIFYFTDIHEPLAFSLGAIVILGVAAGLTSPGILLSVAINLCISIVGFFFFEYYAVRASLYSPFFFTNQILALLFLIALYYSIKTLRGWGNPFPLRPKKEPPTDDNELRMQ
jgi:hypothetical protein